MMVRRHVESENAGREQEMGKRERERETSQTRKEGRIEGRKSIEQNTYGITIEHSL